MARCSYIIWVEDEQSYDLIFPRNSGSLNCIEVLKGVSNYIAAHQHQIRFSIYTQSHCVVEINELFHVFSAWISKRNLQSSSAWDTANPLKVEKKLGLEKQHSWEVGEITLFNKLKVYWRSSHRLESRVFGVAFYLSCFLWMWGYDFYSLLYLLRTAFRTPKTPFCPTPSLHDFGLKLCEERAPWDGSACLLGLLAVPAFWPCLAHCQAGDVCLAFHPCFVLLWGIWSSFVATTSLWSYQPHSECQHPSR